MKNVLLSVVIVFVLFGVFIYRILSGDSTMERGLKYESEVNKIKHERDSLKSLFDASRLREQQYILRIEADSIKVVGLEKSIAARESKLKTYKQRVDDISRIIIERPDSFLIKRYGKL